MPYIAYFIQITKLIRGVNATKLYSIAAIKALGGNMFAIYGPITVTKSPNATLLSKRQRGTQT